MKSPNFSRRLLTDLSRFLLLVFFFTNVAAAHKPQETLWSERTQYAALPMNPALLPLPSLPSKNFSALKKNKSNQLSLPALPKFLKNTPLPSDLGAHLNIKEVSGANPTLLIVQDIHQNFEAQSHISATLKLLAKMGQPTTVGLEAAQGRFNFDLYRQLPGREDAIAVADSFLATGDMSGAAHAGLTTYIKEGGENLQFWGVDDAVLYERNLRAYTESHRLKPATLKTLSQIEARLASEKSYFNPALRSFDATVHAYRAGSMTFSDYLHHLSGLTEVSLNAELFLQAYELEKKLDSARVESERRALLEKLVPQLSQAEVQALYDLSLAYQAGRATFADYYRHLNALVAMKGLSLAAMPVFNDYVRYVLLADGVKADGLISEVQRLEETTYQQLTRTPQEKNTVAVSRQAYLAKQLIEFSLTPEQWALYQNDRALLAMNLSVFEDFYRAADARNHALINNLLARKPSHAVLIAGGYHTAGLTAILKGMGRSYIVAAPKLSKVESAANTYLTVFDREKTPLEQMFSGQRLFIDQPQMGAANPLAGAANRLAELTVYQQVLVALRGFTPRAGQLVQQIFQKSVAEFKVVRTGAGVAIHYFLDGFRLRVYVGPNSEGFRWLGSAKNERRIGNHNVKSQLKGNGSRKIGKRFNRSGKISYGALFAVGLPVLVATGWFYPKAVAALLTGMGVAIVVSRAQPKNGDDIYDLLIDAVWHPEVVPVALNAQERAVLQRLNLLAQSRLKDTDVIDLPALRTFLARHPKIKDGLSHVVSIGDRPYEVNAFMHHLVAKKLDEGNAVGLLIIEFGRSLAPTRVLRALLAARKTKNEEGSRLEFLSAMETILRYLAGEPELKAPEQAPSVSFNSLIMGVISGVTWGLAAYGLIGFLVEKFAMADSVAVVISTLGTGAVGVIVDFYFGEGFNRDPKIPVPSYVWIQPHQFLKSDADLPKFTAILREHLASYEGAHVIGHFEILEVDSPVLQLSLHVAAGYTEDHLYIFIDQALSSALKKADELGLTSHSMKKLSAEQLETYRYNLNAAKHYVEAEPEQESQGARPGDAIFYRTLLMSVLSGQALAMEALHEYGVQAKAAAIAALQNRLKNISVEVLLSGLTQDINRLQAEVDALSENMRSHSGDEPDEIHQRGVKFGALVDKLTHMQVLQRKLTRLGLAGLLADEILVSKLPVAWSYSDAALSKPVTQGIYELKRFMNEDAPPEIGKFLNILDAEITAWEAMADHAQKKMAPGAAVTGAGKPYGINQRSGFTLFELLPVLGILGTNAVNFASELSPSAKAVWAVVSTLGFGSVGVLAMVFNSFWQKQLDEADAARVQAIVTARDLAWAKFRELQQSGEKVDTRARTLSKIFSGQFDAGTGLDSSVPLPLFLIHAVLSSDSSATALRILLVDALFKEEQAEGIKSLRLEMANVKMRTHGLLDASTFSDLSNFTRVYAEVGRRSLGEVVASFVERLTYGDSNSSTQAILELQHYVPEFREAVINLAKGAYYPASVLEVLLAIEEIGRVYQSRERWFHKVATARTVPVENASSAFPKAFEFFAFLENEKVAVPLVLSPALSMNVKLSAKAVGDEIELELGNEADARKFAVLRISRSADKLGLVVSNKTMNPGIWVGPAMVFTEKFLNSLEYIALAEVKDYVSRLNTEEEPFFSHVVKFEEPSTLPLNNNRITEGPLEETNGPIVDFEMTDVDSHDASFAKNQRLSVRPIIEGVPEKEGNMDLILGTSGWREGYLDPDADLTPIDLDAKFTRANVGRFATAVAKFLIGQDMPNKRVAVGYDARPNARQFAVLLVEVLAANGIAADLIDQVTATPIMAEATRPGAPYGLALHVTASHNPVYRELAPLVQWLGIKVLSNGMPAIDEFTSKITDIANHDRISFFLRIPYESIPETVSHRGVDLVEASSERLKGSFDLEELRELAQAYKQDHPEFGIVIDSMHGATGKAARIFNELGIVDNHLGTEPIYEAFARGALAAVIPDANGKEHIWGPDPTKTHFSPVFNEQHRNGQLGLKFDGDGDRAVIIDVDGTEILPNQLAVIFFHYLYSLGERGTFIRTIPTTRMIDRMARKYGVRMIDTPVGSKHFGPYADELLVAVEESGHVFFKKRGQVFVDSAIAEGMLAVEIVLKSGKSLGEYYRDIETDLGAMPYERTEIDPQTATPVFKKNLLTLRQEAPARFATELSAELGLELRRDENSQVAERASFDTRDKTGVLVQFADDTWAMARLSGGDGSTRLYVQTQSEADIPRYQRAVVQVLNEIFLQMNLKKLGDGSVVGLLLGVTYAFHKIWGPVVVAAPQYKTAQLFGGDWIVGAVFAVVWLAWAIVKYRNYLKVRALAYKIRTVEKFKASGASVNSVVNLLEVSAPKGKLGLAEFQIQNAYGFENDLERKIEWGVAMNTAEADSLESVLPTPWDPAVKGPSYGDNAGVFFIGERPTLENVIEDLKKLETYYRACADLGDPHVLILIPSTDLELAHSIKQQVSALAAQYGRKHTYFVDATSFGPNINLYYHLENMINFVAEHQQSRVFDNIRRSGFKAGSVTVYSRKKGHVLNVNRGLIPIMNLFTDNMELYGPGALLQIMKAAELAGNDA